MSKCDPSNKFIALCEFRPVFKTNFEVKIGARQDLQILRVLPGDFYNPYNFQFEAFRLLNPTY